jgi:hypothetical protein
VSEFVLTFSFPRILIERLIALDDTVVGQLAPAQQARIDLRLGAALVHALEVGIREGERIYRLPPLTELDLARTSSRVGRC